MLFKVSIAIISEKSIFVQQDQLLMTEQLPLPYQQGLHILCEAFTESTEPLLQYQTLKQKWAEWIQELGLEQVGEVFHDFPTGGFTGVICLTESHISIHTWPEYNYFTFDVFLSNYRRKNDDKGEKLLNDTLELLGVTKSNITKAYRYWHF